MTHIVLYFPIFDFPLQTRLSTLIRELFLLETKETRTIDLLFLVTAAVVCHLLGIQVLGFLLDNYTLQVKLADDAYMIYSVFSNEEAVDLITS